MTLEFEYDGFSVSLAASENDLTQAQALRYDVFVRELGGQGEGVNHSTGLETDQFDDVADHLILRDLKTEDVIGVYRLLRQDHARLVGGFYSAREFDLAPLEKSGRPLLELGRSCVRSDHRSGAAMYLLWQGLARYVQMHQSELMFGVASLKGTNVLDQAGPLSLLHHRYRAPASICAKARQFQTMNLISEAALDRRRAMVQIPPLIKSYLRLGGMVGEGAFVDHAFNCIDVFMILDTQSMNSRSARPYDQARVQ